jgi:hypothetical protein
MLLKVLISPSTRLFGLDTGLSGEQPELGNHAPELGAILCPHQLAAQPVLFLSISSCPSARPSARVHHDHWRALFLTSRSVMAMATPATADICTEAIPMTYRIERIHIRHVGPPPAIAAQHGPTGARTGVGLPAFKVDSVRLEAFPVLWLDCRQDARQVMRIDRSEIRVPGHELGGAFAVVESAQVSVSICRLISASTRAAAKTL